MEYKVTYTKCDICHRVETNNYSSLQMDGWTKYKMNRDWRNGAHAAEHDVEIIVCNKCDHKSSTMHIIFAQFKKLIKK